MTTSEVALLVECLLASGPFARVLGAPVHRHELCKDQGRGILVDASLVDRVMVVRTDAVGHLLDGAVLPVVVPLDHALGNDICVVVVVAPCKLAARLWTGPRMGN